MPDRTGKLGHDESSEMTEEEFLQTYKARDYPKPSVTVDLVIFTVVDTVLKVLLIKRKGHPYKGQWALPGGFVDVGDVYEDQGESIDEAAHRELAEETGLPEGSCYLEQLYTFGDPNRDPRMRVISVAYYALISADKIPLVKAGDDASDAKWFTLDVLGFDRLLVSFPLAFDHAAILAAAVERIRGKIDYAPIAFELVPPTFTVPELRAVHEAIKGRAYDPSNFRRRFQRMLTDGVIEEAEGKRHTGRRPAKVYRFTRR
jgi:8-oxo-dGTP diphosphatase